MIGALPGCKGSMDNATLRAAMDGATLREAINIIKWSTDAAREHVELCVFRGEDPLADCEGNMGLWQSFRATWPKETFPGDYDLAITLYGHTFTETVKAIVACKQVPGRTYTDGGEDQACGS